MCTLQRAQHPSFQLGVLYILTQPVEHILIEFLVIAKAHCRGNKNCRFVRNFFIVECVGDEKLVAFVLVISPT